MIWVGVERRGHIVYNENLSSSRVLYAPLFCRQLANLRPRSCADAEGVRNQHDGDPRRFAVRLQLRADSGGACASPAACHDHHHDDDSDADDDLEYDHDHSESRAGRTTAVAQLCDPSSSSRCKYSPSDSNTHLLDSQKFMWVFCSVTLIIESVEPVLKASVLCVSSLLSCLHCSNY